MTTTLHKSILLADTHPVVGLGPYANAAARQAETGMSNAANFDKFARQTDTGQYWVLSNGLWTRANGPRVPANDASTTYTATVADLDIYRRFTAACIYTLPSDSAVPIPIGGEIEVMQAGSGQVSFAAGSGAAFSAGLTLFGTSGLGAVVRAKKVAANTWDLTGGVAAIAGGFSGDFGALLDSLTSVGSTVGYYRGDLGKSVTGSVVNTWANQITGSGWGNVTEGSSGVGIGSVSSGVGGKAGILANGTTQFGKIVSSPTPLVAPATTPLSYYLVYRNTAAPLSGNMQLLGVSFNFALLQPGSSLNIEQYNGGTQVAGATTTNVWARLRATFTGTTSDSIKYGSTAVVTGANSGNAGGGSGPLGLFADPSGGYGFAAFEIALLLISRATPANFAAAMSSMDSAVTSWFGGTVSV